MARLFETSSLKLYKNEIPWVKFKIEITQVRNRPSEIIVEAIIWGDLAYDLIKYYHLNDYMLVEGYLLTDLAINKKIVSLNIFQIYPVFRTTGFNG